MPGTDGWTKVDLIEVQGQKGYLFVDGIIEAEPRYIDSSLLVDTGSSYGYIHSRATLDWVDRTSRKEGFYSQGALSSENNAEENNATHTVPLQLHVGDISHEILNPSNRVHFDIPGILGTPWFAHFGHLIVDLEEKHILISHGSRPIVPPNKDGKTWVGIELLPYTRRTPMTTPKFRSGAEARIWFEDRSFPMWAMTAIFDDPDFPEDPWPKSSIILLEMGARLNLPTVLVSIDGHEFAAVVDTGYTGGIAWLGEPPFSASGRGNPFVEMGIEGARRWLRHPINVGNVEIQFPHFDRITSIIPNVENHGVQALIGMEMFQENRLWFDYVHRMLYIEMKTRGP